MPRSTLSRLTRRVPPRATAAFVFLAGAVVALATSMASASSFTLRVEKNVHVTNDPTKAFRVRAVNTREPVAVGPSGYAVYTFQGETTRHLICHKTNNPSTNCWAFWPPVSVSSRAVRAQPGIKGRLGTFRNHGTLQLTLNGQPLYYFTPDLQSQNKARATGDELKTFGSIWHVVGADPSVNAGPFTPAAPMQTTPTTTTSTGPYPYGY